MDELIKRLRDYAEFESNSRAKAMCDAADALEAANARNKTMEMDIAENDALIDSLRDKVAELEARLDQTERDCAEMAKHCWDFEAQTNKAPADSEFVKNLKRDLLMSKATHNFTFSRDKMIELIGGKFQLLGELASDKDEGTK